MAPPGRIDHGTAYGPGTRVGRLGKTARQDREQCNPENGRNSSHLGFVAEDSSSRTTPPLQVQNDVRRQDFRDRRIVLPGGQDYAIDGSSSIEPFRGRETLRANEQLASKHAQGTWGTDLLSDFGPGDGRIMEPCRAATSFSFSACFFSQPSAKIRRAFRCKE